MSPSKEKGIAGHAASRAKTCIVCLKKSDRPLTTYQIEGLRTCTTIFESITPEDLRVPTGICNTCKSILNAKMQASKKGKTNDRVFKIPQGFTFALHVILPRTRSEEASFCNCLLCQVSSKQGNAKRIDLNEIIKNAIHAQTPDILEPMEVNETQMEPDKNLKYCSHCFSLIGKGLSHVCNDTTALENLKALHEKRPILAQAFAAYVVKQTPSSPHQTRRLSQLHGPKLPAVIGKPKPPLDKITLTKLAEFGNKNWLSQNQMRAFGQFLGENKVKIEADLQQELVRRNHILDEYYEVETVDFLIDGQLVRKKWLFAKTLVTW